MASAGRRSELKALVFDLQYIQFKPEGVGITLYFTSEFMRKNLRPNQVNDLWCIPVVLNGKPDFGAPNCPVRALRYYHRYMTEHPELRKGRRHLYIPFKDNNAGKELIVALISRWIYTTIVDSHASLQNSKSIQWGSCCGYFITTLQPSRPKSSHEGQEMVQWRNLHVLLPLRHLPTS